MVRKDAAKAYQEYMIREHRGRFPAGREARPELPRFEKSERTKQKEEARREEMTQKAVDPQPH